MIELNQTMLRLIKQVGFYSCFNPSMVKNTLTMVEPCSYINHNVRSKTVTFSRFVLTLYTQMTEQY